MQLKMQIQQNNKYDIFLDISGSVGGSVAYWNTVHEVFCLYSKDISNYYFWDSQIELVDKKQFQQAIATKKGRGGTNPTLVANKIVQKNLKNIILLTDGEVGNYEVQQCDKVLEKYKLEKSLCYIISSNRYEAEPNMSVTCAFTRNCDNKVFKKKGQDPLQEVVSFTVADYKILQTLDTITLQNFEAEYNKIEGLIIALNMGKQGNIPLKNDLVIMKNRLIKQLSKQKGQQKKQLSQVVRQYLQKNDFISAINEMGTISKAYFADSITADLQNKISHLISLCGDLRGKYNLNEIKSNKMATAKDATEGNIDKQIEVHDLSKNPIECPILNEDDVPQILVDQCEPLLMGVEKGIVDDIAACPLRLLNYPDIKAKLKSRLSNYVGVMGIKAKFDQKLLKNPFTQNRLLGSIPLGTHKSHVKVGNYTIAKLISGGKILGNMNLYYAAIWYIIHQGQIEYLKDIEKNATQHLTFRMKNSKTYASMCGQSQFVTTQVNTDIAVWYCVNSGYLNQPTDRDTFRFHYYNLQPMIKIVEVLGYPIDKGLMPHYHRTKNLLSFLSIFKAMKSPSDKKTFKNMLIGLYQNGMFVDVDGKYISKKFTQTEICTQFIPLDGPASAEQVLKIRTLFSQKYKFTQPLSNEQLFYIGNLVDPQKLASAYFLDYNLIVPKFQQAKVNWKYGLQKHEDNVKVCPKTLRPYYTLDKESWDQVAEKTWNMKKQDLFNGFKYFENYVFKYDKLPTFSQLVLFYYNRYVEGGKTTTLPFLTQQWTQETIAQYTPFFKTMTMKAIKTLLNESRVIKTRILIEQQKS